MQQNTPAGWYPDPQFPGQQRYWNGIQWTEHTAPLAPNGPVPPAQQYAANGPAAQPIPAPAQVAPQQNWFLRHKIMSAVMAVIVIAVIGSSMSGGSDDNGAVANTASVDSATHTEKPSKADSASKPKLSMQDRFVDIVEKGADEAGDSDNEIKVVQARKKRASAMCGLLSGSQAVKGWTGTVDEVSTELGGDNGVLAISLTDDIKVSTWNNSLSDLDAHTLIDPNSGMFTQLGDLSEGDEVSFSGHFIKQPGKCMEEQSVMDENGMLTPTFSFKFASFQKN